MHSDSTVDSHIIIKDDVLDAEKIGQYHLSLGFSDTEFSIGIVDNENHRCLFFESVVLPNFSTMEDLLGFLDKIYEQHSFLSAGFWQGITSFVRNQRFTLVPDDYFTEESKEEWLNMATGAIEEPDEVMAYYHKKLKSHMVFAFPELLKKWLMEKYPLVEIKFIHQLSSLIEGCALMKQGGKFPEIFAHIDQQWLSLLVYNEKGLLMANRFLCHEPRDFAEFALMTYKNYNINPEENSLTVYGNFNADAPVLEQLHRYIPLVKQGKRPWKLYFSYPFDDLEEHKYFGTFSAWFCK